MNATCAMAGAISRPLSRNIGSGFADVARYPRYLRQRPSKQMPWSQSMLVSQESGGFGASGGAAFSRAAGLTQTPPTQIRSPLQSVSLKHPWGAAGGASGGNSVPTGRGTHDGLSCWQAAALPVMHCAFRSFSCSQRAELLNPETAEATKVAASAVERSVAPALTPLRCSFPRGLRFHNPAGSR